MKTIDINKFRGIKVEIKYKHIMDKYADKTKAILEAKSPHSDRPNRATPYRTGWTTEVRPRDGEYSVTVWNRTNWQLTHLLENGHFITNSPKAIYWSPPIKHIKPSYDYIKDDYIHAMENAEVSADFK